VILTKPWRSGIKKSINHYSSGYQTPRMIRSGYTTPHGYTVSLPEIWVALEDLHNRGEIIQSGSMFFARS